MAERILNPVPDGCPECALKDETIALLERDLRAKRTQISRLKGERNKASQMSPFWSQAEECFARWNEVCREGRAKEFSGPRAENTVARLEATQTVEDIFKGIEGARALAAGECNWKPKPPFDRLTELASICESEATLTRYQGYADEAKEKRLRALQATRHVFVLWNERFDGRNYLTDELSHVVTGKCPACGHYTAALNVKATLIKCMNGCAEDAILQGLRKWAVELYPDRTERRMALNNARDLERMARWAA